MAEKKYGIKDLKEMVVFVAKVGNAVDVSAEDGIGVDDLGSFVPAFMSAPQAFEGVSEIPKEAKDLDAEEMKELQDALAKELDLKDDALEAVIEKSLAAIASIFAIAQEIKALKDA